MINQISTQVLDTCKAAILRLLAQHLREVHNCLHRANIQVVLGTLCGSHAIYKS